MLLEQRKLGGDLQKNLWRNRKQDKQNKARVTEKGQTSVAEQPGLKLFLNTAAKC